MTLQDANHAPHGLEEPPYWTLRTNRTICRSFELPDHQRALQFVTVLCSVAITRGQKMAALGLHRNKISIELPWPDGSTFSRSLNRVAPAGEGEP